MAIKFSKVFRFFLTDASLLLEPGRLALFQSIFPALAIDFEKAWHYPYSETVIPVLPRSSSDQNRV